MEMHLLRIHVSPRAITIFLDNELSFLGPLGLGRVPLLPRGLVWPVGRKVQSVRYYSDICGTEPRCSSQRGILGRVVSTALYYSSSSASASASAISQIHDTSAHVLSSSFNKYSTNMPEKRVCVVGSGNWGSAIARIVGFNAKHHSSLHETVTMYVYEEMVEGKKLTEIINEQHENVKYLPGYKIPPNVVAVPDLVEAAKDADILIFVVPHQFIQRICSTLKGKIKPSACGLSLIKGFEQAEGGGIELISRVIKKLLNIPVSVLMGANIAQEVAAEQFCETTIGCKNKEMAPIFQDLIQTENFRVVVVDDADTVEVCGALKNVVAVGAGIVDGLQMGDNTKAAIIRLGLMEMIKFIQEFYPGCKLSTFFESCGIADLITTCYGGRNRKVAEAFVKSKKTIDELEREMLNGQKLQGPITADAVHFMLKERKMEDKFPLMTAVHKICQGEVPPTALIDAVRCHPEHMNCNCRDKITRLHNKIRSLL